MKTEKWVSKQIGKEVVTKPETANEKGTEQACCGRSYNETNDFSQVNFAAYQSILDQRNQLLGSVPGNRP